MKRKIKSHKGGRPHKTSIRFSELAWHKIQALLDANKSLTLADIVNSAILNLDENEIAEQEILQQILDTQE